MFLLIDVHRYMGNSLKLILIIFITSLFITTVVVYITKLNSNQNLIGLHNKIKNSSNANTKVFLSTYPNLVIDTTWEAHKKKIQKDGRTLDRSRNLITTSEGQSYSMLRAVWMNDKQIFDTVWKWTKNNLQKREGDSLLAWKWGQNKEGVWDVLVDEGGKNSASDADLDVALALIFAYNRWNNPLYLEEANKLLNDIWKHEVIIINDQPYLTAGNWAKEEKSPTINLSYLSPAHFEIFSKYNSQNKWKELKDTTYIILNLASQKSFSDKEGVFLPSDWISIDRETNSIKPSSNSNQTLNFSDDAIRVPFRVALDYLWFKDTRAKEYLLKLNFLNTEWETKKKIYATYNKFGENTVNYESKSLYGATLPYFIITNPKSAKEIYLNKLAPLYNPDTEEFDNLGYYDENWVWFGIAYYNKKLINLAE